MTKPFQMHITLVSAEYPPTPGGLGDYTQRLGAALIGRGAHVAVLTGIHTLPTTATPELPPRLSLDLVTWNWRSWPAVARVARLLDTDVVHIQYQTGAYGMHPAINLLPRWLRTRGSHARVVVTMHDLLEPYLFPKAGLARRWVTRRLVRDSDAVIVTNEEDQRRAQAHYRARNPTLIPIGSNIDVVPPVNYEREQWRTAHGTAANDLLIAYFGLISPSKGLDTLLLALAQLPPRARLVVIGGEATAPQDRAYATTVRSQVAALGLEQRVLFTGQCDASTVSAHLLAADSAALPFTDGASFRRGSLLAALAHGVPTVTTSTGHSQLAAEKEALLVPPNNAEALATAIARLGDDAPLRARLAEGGQSLARRFSWEHIAVEHLALYQLVQQATNG